MIDILRSLFGSGPEKAGPEGSDTPSPENLRKAAAVLLLELAWADEEFTAEERTHVVGVLQRHFGLSEDGARDLVAESELERAGAVDLWQFTSVIRDHYSLGQKMVLAESMWGLVFSDGVLSDHENYLIRRISGLLGIEVGYLSQARKNWHEGGANGGE